MAPGGSASRARPFRSSGRTPRARQLLHDACAYHAAARPSR